MILAYYLIKQKLLRIQVIRRGLSSVPCVWYMQPDEFQYNHLPTKPMIPWVLTAGHEVPSDTWAKKNPKSSESDIHIIYTHKKSCSQSITVNTESVILIAKEQNLCCAKVVMWLKHSE